MKRIELTSATESLTVGNKKEDIEIKTIDLIKTAINNTPPGGFAYSDMINRLRIGDVVEAHQKDPNPPSYLELEDADFENLKKYVHDTKWGVLSKTIVEFIKSLG